MKIGGYKQNPSTSDIDLSPEVQNTEGVGEEASKADEVVSQSQQVSAQPEIQDTSIDIQITGEFDETKSTETVVNTEEDKSSLNKDVATDRTATEVVGTGKVAEVPVEISEELHLKYLSEKLGREVKSFDELINAEVSTLDSDPYLKGLAEWRQKTGRPIEDWIKYQKDYTKVSDADVAREFLQLQYPELTPEEIDLELNRKYIASEDDFSDDKAIKNLELKKLASKGRKELIKLVSDLGNPNATSYTPEVQSDLDLAKQYKTLVKQNELFNKEYSKSIAAKATELQSIKLDLAEGVSLDYKLPQGSDKTLIEAIETARHWKNNDGSWNHQAIVRDSAIVANFDAMLKLAFEQGKNSGADDVIREAKNTTLGNRVSNESAIANQKKGAQIEGLENYLGNRGMKIIRGGR